MKFRRLFKKAAVALMAAVTALSVLPATTAFAAGDIGTISFTHTYDSSGNTMRYNSSAVFDGYTAGGTGKYKYRMFVDGENAFCIQPGVPLKTGNTLKKASSDTWNALSTNQKKAVGLALLYGYQGNRSHLSGSDDEKWLATQTLVWEFVTGCREATGSYQQNSTKAYSLHFGSNYPNSGAKAAYDQIVSLLSEHTWIPQEDIQRFVIELLTPSSYAAGRIRVRYTAINGDWFIENKSSDYGNVKADSTYGTKRASAYRIIEDTLNLRDVRIFDYVLDEHGNRKAVFNHKETTAAQAKQEVIKQAFQDWIWKDPERRNRLVRSYNDTFNSVRPREYDGSHITFGGISPEITLRPHQVNAIAHILYGGNTLLAHKVGAGKSATRS